MEIRSAIHTSVNQVQLPFFSNLLLPSKLNYPLHNSPSSIHTRPSIPLKWRRRRRHQLSTTRSLSDDTAASLSVATESDDDGASVGDDAAFELKKKATYVSADLKGTSIFLVGMNSAMKNQVGEILSESLRYYYFDSDNLVEEAAGKDSSGKSFKERDEDGFRESETEVLKQLSSMGRLVVNAGNGAVQGATNLALLRHGIAIWIDVPLDMIAKELIGDEDQSSMSNISTPDSFSEALARLTQLYEEHRGGYALADVTISLQNVASKCAYDEVDQVTAEDVALEALKEIEKLTRVKKMMEQAGRPF
ncbi:putative inactive shikimate kinase like 1, chloroplastic [Silene latifolia]|uniref:putative inactive shikimate kinase like 1, chloroplastic n=1 Tax=Silene latifolia TaxID=37657 RepID=UPI003D77757C